MGKRSRKELKQQQEAERSRELVERMRKEAEPLAISTQQLIGDDQRHASLRVTRGTTYGLGGVSIHVTGTGKVTIDKQAFGPSERTLTHTLTLPGEDVAALFAAFVVADFARIVIPDHTGMPDEPHYSIELTNAAGQTRRASKFVRCEVPAFERLVSVVGALVARHLDTELRKRLTI